MPLFHVCSKSACCSRVCRGIPTCHGMGALSLPIPHGMYLVVPTHPYFFWVVCHLSRKFPLKELEREPQNRLFPLPTAIPYPFLPQTHDPPLPVLAEYRMVMSGPYACSTSVYVRNLSTAYAFAMFWRLICTFCRPSLTSYDVSYFLISHPLWPAPFRG